MTFIAAIAAVLAGVIIAYPRTRSIEAPGISYDSLGTFDWGRGVLKSGRL